MKIAVIAANGRTGREFVRAALEAGHEIRAGVRSRGDLDPLANLELIECDATHPKQVKNLIMGCDAVASFIGHVNGSKANVQTAAITTVIAAMKEQGIKRIVSLTGTGVRQPGDKITLIDRILNMSISQIDPARVKDGIEHAKVLEASDLEWTIIRVLKLQDTRPNYFALTPHGPTKPYVSRTEVALAVLQVLERNSLVKEMPIISKQ